MTRTELDILATYNAEEARGIMHTETWQIRMSKLQADWNRLVNREGLDAEKALTD